MDTVKIWTFTTEPFIHVACCILLKPPVATDSSRSKEKSAVNFLSYSARIWPLAIDCLMPDGIQTLGPYRAYQLGMGGLERSVNLSLDVNVLLQLGCESGSGCLVLTHQLAHERAELPLPRAAEFISWPSPCLTLGSQFQNNQQLLNLILHTKETEPEPPVGPRPAEPSSDKRVPLVLRTRITKRNPGCYFSDIHPSP